ncbi:MAG: ATPase, T2SS/T4P/T4SS family, partial [Planctomycetota bacterium]
MAYLQIKTKDGAKRFLVDGAGVTIGRQLGNVIHLKDDMASRFHAVVETAGENIHVRDLDSRNGLKVNGQVAKQQSLSDGDVIQIGRTKIVFRTGQTEAVENQLKHFADESTDQPQTALQSLAESLPSKSFNIADLQVLNTRGQIVHGSQAKTDDGKKAPGEAVTLLRLVLLVCFRTRASDIHIEPKSEHTLVRVRIDGTMVDIAKLKADVGNRLATVVKVLCDIDLHGKNIVQEGSFAAKVPDRRVDYRVSFSPSVSGQKLVIRVLDEANAPRYMWELGLPEPVFKALDKSMKRDAGTVIVCGPTGSGKTATLYATLRSIDQNE